MALSNIVSKEQLQAIYEANTRENTLLRFALMDIVNDAINWQDWVAIGDGTSYRYGWARLDSASGGYLAWIFRAPGQRDMIRVEYLDWMQEHKPRYEGKVNIQQIKAIEAALSARSRYYVEQSIASDYGTARR